MGVAEEQLRRYALGKGVGTAESCRGAPGAELRWHARRQPGGAGAVPGSRVSELRVALARGTSEAARRSRDGGSRQKWVAAQSVSDQAGAAARDRQQRVRVAAAAYAACQYRGVRNYPGKGRVPGVSCHIQIKYHRLKASPANKDTVDRLGLQPADQSRTSKMNVSHQRLH